jgi:sulfur dioxygenase
MIFRQMFDPTSSTYTYLLSDGGEAILIDPVLEQAERDAMLIGDLGLELLWTLETHVHADHITGAWTLKEKLGSRIALSAAGKASGADRLLHDGDHVHFGERVLEVRATPGHTASCLTYVLDDRSMAFTGDCVLIRGCGRTDFQEGDSPQLYRSVREKIFSLPDACLLYPGHDYRGFTVTSVAEEKAHNPRLGLARSEQDFAECMANLKLAYPKKIDVAVPANLQCGRQIDAELKTP